MDQQFTIGLWFRAGLLVIMVKTAAKWLRKAWIGAYKAVFTILVLTYIECGCTMDVMDLVKSLLPDISISGTYLMRIDILTSNVGRILH